MVTLHCEVCGGEFTAKRTNAKYCGPACRRKIAHLTRSGIVVPIAPPRGERPQEYEYPQMVKAVRDHFTAAQLDTAPGALALRLAADVDSLPLGAPGMSSLARELRTAIDALTESAAPKQVNPLMAMRERHAGSSATG